MFKAIFFDLDGTVINDDFSIPSGLSELIKNLKKSNIKVAFATGRSFLSALPYIEELNITDSSVFSNGAAYQDPVNNLRLTTLDSFHSSVLIPIVEALKSADIAFRLQQEDSMLLAYKMDYWPSKFARTYLTPFAEDFYTKKILKIVINWPHPASQLLELLKLTAADMKKIRFLRTDASLIEIALANINKAAGIKKIISSLNIKENETIAVGDQENDYEMIASLGLGIAVKTGYKENLKNAKHHISSPENGGIAELKEIFQLEYKLF